MPTSNPFKVLGLDPQTLKSLKPDQRRRVIEVQYRTLQHIHHPDKGGDPRKAAELNWAKDELASDEQLKTWLEVSTKKAKGGLQARLENMSRFAAFQQRFTLLLYASMWRIGASGGNYVDLLGIGEEEITLCRAISMSQRDTALAGLGSEIEDEEERKRFRRMERQKLIDRTFYRLSVGNGRLMETDCKGVSKDISSQLLVGVVTQETIRKEFNGSQEPIYNFLRKVCPEPGSKATAALPFSYSADAKKRELAVSIPAQRFVRLFPHLTQETEPESWLFSMTIRERIPSFRLEGQIFRAIPQAKVMC